MAMTATRAGWRAAGHRRSVERAGLLVSTAIFLVGLGLLLAAVSPSIRSVGAELAGGGVVSLDHLAEPERLEPLFEFWSDAQDRRFASRIVAQFVRREEGISSVGALSRIRVGPNDYDGAGMVWKSRAAARGGHARPVALLNGSQLARIKSRLIVRTPSQFLRDVAMWCLAFCLPFWAVHALWRRSSFCGDQIVLPVLQALAGIGFLVMIALRDPLRDAELFANFALGVLAGAALLAAISLVDVERWLERLSFIPLLLSVLLSILLLLFGRGPAGSDAKVNLGPLQPVEWIKLLLVLFMAGYFGQHWQFLRYLRGRGPLAQRISWIGSMPRLDYALPVFFCNGIALVFFFLQKDLGPALVFGAVFLSLYASARNSFGLALSGAALLAGGIAAGYSAGFPATVVRRVQMWLSPWANAVRGGDQLAHSLWGFSGGRLFGSGLGFGEAGFMPAGHTDLVLSAVGEELGWIGVFVVFVLYALLFWRGYRIACDRREPYGFFLAFGLLILLAAETLLISSGVLGLAPLSGVVSPFLSYGRTSMVANLAAFGVLLSLSNRPRAAAASSPFRAPARKVAAVTALIAIAVVVRAAWIQLAQPGRTVSSPTLVLQADGVFRYQYNPRLVRAARRTSRATIYDRNHIPLATDRWEEVDRAQAAYASMGVSPEEYNSRASSRIYPLGPAAFHLLGDRRRRLAWTAPNTAFVERDMAVRIQGYEDRGRTELAPDPRGGAPLRVVRFDYTPLAASLYAPKAGGRLPNAGLELTIDARLQARIAAALRQRAGNAGASRGAAVVLDPSTGDLLALVSWPAPGQQPAAALTDEELLDRARFGLYPPGSVFKIVVTMAAMRSGLDWRDEEFRCERLPDGRSGALVRNEIIRDDASDRFPHGRLSIDRALRVSCNAYFANLGLRLGARPLFTTASQFRIRSASPNTAERLAANLPRASFGQGEVLASPMQMARVVGAVANGGLAVPVHLLAGTSMAGESVLDPADAAALGAMLRSVVTSGTASRVLASHPVTIAGKTGTAEVSDARSHSWFVGYAPYDRRDSHKIAFAVIVENGGYGGGVATAVAGDIVEAARDLGLIAASDTRSRP